MRLPVCQPGGAFVLFSFVQVVKNHDTFFVHSNGNTEKKKVFYVIKLSLNCYRYDAHLRDSRPYIWICNLIYDPPEG